MKRLALYVTITFNLYRNWLWSSDFHKQFYLYKLFTTHFIYYLFRTLHQVTYSSYLHIFHLFSLFQQSNDKTQVLLFPPKVLRFFVLDSIVHVSKSFEHPTHSKSIVFIQLPSFLPKKILNSFKPYTVSCIAHSDNSVHPFYPSPSSSTLFTFPTILHLEYCTTPFILLFQQRNAHSHTAFFKTSKVPDSSLF